MDPDRVAVVGQGALRLSLAQADRGAAISTKQIVNGLPSLALYLVDPSPAQRSEKLAIEREALLERADHEVQVIEVAHGVVLAGAERIADRGGEPLRRLERGDCP